MATLFDQVVRHQIYVEGLKANKANDFYGTISLLSAELRTQLSQIDFENLGDLTKTALNKLLVSLRAAVRRIFDPWLKDWLRWLEQYCEVETDLFASIFGVEKPNPAPIFAAAKTEPMPANGLFLVPFLSGFGLYALARIERLVVMGRANRVTKEDLMRQFNGTKARQFKDGLARQLTNLSNAATSTVIQHIGTQTNFGVARASFGLYEWVSVLDDRTTNICSDRDGNRYEYGRGPVPPAHVGCRSSIVPVRNGEPVTPEFDFRMWAQRQPAEFINDALDGKLSSRYERSQPLTLSAFAAKGPIIRM